MRHRNLSEQLTTTILTMEDFPEKSGAAVANYHAIDPDNQANNVHYYVTGVDAADFTVEGGVLKFVSPPNYENPTDREYDVNYH